MQDEKDFQRRTQRVSELVRQIEEIGDPATQATSRELVQLLMELHGAGLEKMMEIVFQAGDHGAHIIDEFGRTPLVGSLLILYGLHPDDLRTRVAKALERIQPSLRKQGSDVALLAIDEGVVRLRIETGGHACGSTIKTIRSTVEEAMYEAAPDIQSLVIEGLEEQAASGFVALDKLIGGQLSAAADRTSAPRVEGAD